MSPDNMKYSQRYLDNFMIKTNSKEMAGNKQMFSPLNQTNRLSRNPQLEHNSKNVLR